MKDKSLNRGGTYGQEGEISGPGDQGIPKPGEQGMSERRRQEILNQRDQQKQRGGEGHEPDLEHDKHVQPTHVVD